MSSSISKKLRALKDYREMDAKTRDQILIEYAPLIKYIAQKIAARLPSNIEIDDLISCGVIGLMDAIQKFDATRENKFKTYAEFRVRGAMLDELRAQDWVPRSVREKAKLVERTYSKLESELGRPATDDEMCTELNLPQEEFHELLDKAKSVSLLNIDDASFFNKGDRKLMANFMEDSTRANPFVAVSHKNLKEMVKIAIESLPEKQRVVLSLYYYEDLNLKDIGQVLGVTESRVSQLHTQAIVGLKTKLRYLSNDTDSSDKMAA